MSLKESIERELGISTRIRAGMPGSLEVYAGGTRIYSKKQSGRLPAADEVIALLRRQHAN